MDYFKAIEKYTQVLVDTGVEIVHTLLDVLVQDSNSNEYIQKFDEILSLLVKICDK